MAHPMCEVLWSSPTPSTLGRMDGQLVAFTSWDHNYSKIDAVADNTNNMDEPRSSASIAPKTAKIPSDQKKKRVNSTVTGLEQVNVPKHVEVSSAPRKEGNSNGPMQSPRVPAYFGINQFLLITGRRYIRRKEGIKIVPEAEKDEAYHAKRSRNRVNSQLCRNKKRQLDEDRAKEIIRLAEKIGLLEKRVDKSEIQCRSNQQLEIEVARLQNALNIIVSSNCTCITDDEFKPPRQRKARVDADGNLKSEKKRSKKVDN